VLKYIKIESYHYNKIHDKFLHIFTSSIEIFLYVLFLKKNLFLINFSQLSSCNIHLLECDIRLDILMRMIKFIIFCADFAMPRDTGAQFFMA